jgi:hypothetical protein
LIFALSTVAYQKFVAKQELEKKEIKFEDEEIQLLTDEQAGESEDHENLF